MKRYLEKMELRALLQELDELSRHEVSPEYLKNVKRIKIVHGEKDRIAPIGEAREIKNELPRAEFIAFRGAGHLPFLRKDFRERVFGE